MARLYSECIRCRVNSDLEKYPEWATEEQKVEFMQKFLQIVAETPQDVSAPVIVRDLDQLLLRMFGVKKEYTQEKIHFNQLMMEQEERIRQMIAQAEDPVKMAIQYSMIGNYIDFSATYDVEESVLREMLGNVSEQCPVEEHIYRELCENLTSAKRLLFLTDNCGEIVLDKLLLEVLKARYPQLEITVMVRGEAVLNDATMEDARQVGLTEMVKVIGNGNNIAGTWIPELSGEAKAVLDEADLILSKGQGNFECMQGCGLNVYYIFLCKCKLFAEAFQVPAFTGMLVHDRDALDRRRGI